MVELIIQFPKLDGAGGANIYSDNQAEDADVPER
jgi:hypothetical protein